MSKYISTCDGWERPAFDTDRESEEVMDPLNPITIESLARALHEDNIAASRKVHGEKKCQREYAEYFRRTGLAHPGYLSYDQLNETNKNVRREQARLLIERMMR